MAFAPFPSDSRQEKSASVITMHFRVISVIGIGRRATSWLRRSTTRQKEPAGFVGVHLLKSFRILDRNRSEMAFASFLNDWRQKTNAWMTRCHFRANSIIGIGQVRGSVFARRRATRFDFFRSCRRSEGTKRTESASTEIVTTACVTVADGRSSTGADDGRPRRRLPMSLTRESSTAVCENGVGERCSELHADHPRLCHLSVRLGRRLLPQWPGARSSRVGKRDGPALRICALVSNVARSAASVTVALMRAHLAYSLSSAL